MRAVKFAGAAVVAVMIVLALVLVVGIPSGFLTSTIASRIESATGYRASIGGTTTLDHQQVHLQVRNVIILNS